MSHGAKPTAALPNDVAALQALLWQHQATLAQLTATIGEQEQKIQQLEQQLAQWLKRTFGPRREQIDSDQLLLFSVEELEALTTEFAASIVEDVDDSLAEQPSAAASSASTTRTGHGRRALPSSLPREQKMYELTESERGCPCCQSALKTSQ